MLPNIVRVNDQFLKFLTFMNSTVSELVAAAEEVCIVPYFGCYLFTLQNLQCVSDVKVLTSTGEHLILATGSASKF